MAVYVAIFGIMCFFSGIGSYMLIDYLNIKAELQNINKFGGYNNDKQ